ncbi:MAG: zf-HC2 domain-containing protein [Pseudomonadota bacterium]
MDCRQVDRCLEANLDGRLGGFERVALRQHLRQCRACRSKVEAMSAFSASIERSFAAADGPEWHRLTPPSLPWGLAETSEAAAGSSRRATVPPRRRPGRWRAPVVAGGLVLAVLVAVQLWSGRQPVPEASGTRLSVPLAPTTPALVAEATRRAAGRPVDLATSDLLAAEAWLTARGVSAPDLASLAEIGLAGVFLDHVNAQRVAGFALETAEGAFVLYLIPPSAGMVPAIGWAEHEGLMALAGPWRDWQAVLVGGSGQLFPPALADRLRGLSVAR